MQSANAKADDSAAAKISAQSELEKAKNSNNGVFRTAIIGAAAVGVVYFFSRRKR